MWCEGSNKSAAVRKKSPATPPIQTWVYVELEADNKILKKSQWLYGYAGHPEFILSLLARPSLLVIGCIWFIAIIVSSTPVNYCLFQLTCSNLSPKTYLPLFLLKTMYCYMYILRVAIWWTDLLRFYSIHYMLVCSAEVHRWLRRGLLGTRREPVCFSVHAMWKHNI